MMKRMIIKTIASCLCFTFFYLTINAQSQKKHFLVIDTNTGATVYGPATIDQCDEEINKLSANEKGALNKMYRYTIGICNECSDENQPQNVQPQTGKRLATPDAQNAPIMESVPVPAPSSPRGGLSTTTVVNRPAPSTITQRNSDGLRKSAESARAWQNDMIERAKAQAEAERQRIQNNVNYIRNDDQQNLRPMVKSLESMDDKTDGENTRNLIENGVSLEKVKAAPRHRTTNPYRRGRPAVPTTDNLNFLAKKAQEWDEQHGQDNLDNDNNGQPGVMPQGKNNSINTQVGNDNSKQTNGASDYYQKASQYYQEHGGYSPYASKSSSNVLADNGSGQNTTITNNGNSGYSARAATNSNTNNVSVQKQSRSTETTNNIDDSQLYYAVPIKSGGYVLEPHTLQDNEPCVLQKLNPLTKQYEPIGDGNKAQCMDKLNADIAQEQKRIEKMNNAAQTIANGANYIYSQPIAFEKELGGGRDKVALGGGTQAPAQYRIVKVPVQNTVNTQQPNTQNNNANPSIQQTTRPSQYNTNAGSSYSISPSPRTTPAVSPSRVQPSNNSGKTSDSQATMNSQIQLN